MSIYVALGRKASHFLHQEYIQLKTYLDQQWHFNANQRQRSFPALTSYCTTICTMYNAQATEQLLQLEVVRAVEMRIWREGHLDKRKGSDLNSLISQHKYIFLKTRRRKKLKRFQLLLCSVARSYFQGNCHLSLILIREANISWLLLLPPPKKRTKKAICGYFPSCFPASHSLSFLKKCRRAHKYIRLLFSQT